MTMTKEVLLNKYLDRAYNNLLCYSDNYLMDKPKKGKEIEWEMAKNEILLLEEMLKEVRDANSR